LHELRASVRTHEHHERPIAPNPDLNGGKARRLVLHGKKYSSVTRAAHARHVAPRRIYDWIAAGRGHFL
jgi:hypothetical protein